MDQTAAIETRAKGKASSKAVDTLPESKRKKGRKAGRRRRGKKDVILDFTKRAKKPATKESFDEVARKKPSGATRTRTDGTDFISAGKSQTKQARGKLNLATSSRDYAGNLGLPERVTQREYETTGQFFRRLNRLVAKAKVEASLESRFDMSLAKSQEQQTMAAECDSEPKVEHKLNKSKRTKR